MFKRMMILLALLTLPTFASPIELLYSGSKLWLPSSFMAEGGVAAMQEKIVGVTAMGGKLLVVFTIFAEAARVYLSKESFQIKDVWKHFGKHIIMLILVARTSFWAHVVNAVILAPCEAVISLIKAMSSDEAMKAFGEAVIAASSAQYEGIQSVITSIFQQGFATVLLTLCTTVAITISFALSLYICVMWVILYCVGPMLLPLTLFQPLSSIGWSWIRSFLAFSLMGAVGSIAMGMLVGGGMLTDCIKLGAKADLIGALAYSIIIIVVLCMVPSFTLRLFDGVGAQPLGVARTLAAITTTAASAGALGVGLSAMGAGGAMKAASGAAKAVGVAGAGRVASMGQAAADFGKVTASSQLPNLQRGVFPNFSAWSQSGKKES